MKSTFTKMHSLGNDFVVLEAEQCALSLQDLPIKELANRHTGIGFDQFLWLEKTSDADIACRIFNADGSEAEQCGNGVRCVAHYLRLKGKIRHPTLTIQTKAGCVSASLDSSHFITVNMGKPRIIGHKNLTFEGQSYALTLVNMGNPHALLKVDTLDLKQVKKLGQFISTHPDFPEGVNVGFMQIIDRKTLTLRTYERGAGLTLACGSNACASVAAGLFNQELNKEVEIQLPLGSLFIQCKEEDLYMKGPVTWVFKGEF